MVVPSFHKFRGSYIINRLVSQIGTHDDYLFFKLNSKDFNLGTGQICPTKMNPKLLLFVFAIIFCQQSHAKTWYVSQSVHGIVVNGLYWSTSFRNLQPAFAAAAAGDTIKVAAGIYIPGNRYDSSFAVKSGVVVLGGYSATDSLSARNFSANKTILSGRFSPSASVFHVLKIEDCNEATVLDGFIIEEGDADGERFDNTAMGGGALITWNSRVKISNCVFRNNKGGEGSAVAVLGSSPTFENCMFLYNRSFSSGTIYAQNAPEVVLRNVLFSGNAAGRSGSIAYVSGGTVSFINGTFFRNTVSDINNDLPASMAALNGAVLNIRNSLFFLNIANTQNGILDPNKKVYEHSEIAISGATAHVTNSLLQNFTAGTNLLLALNPRFRDTSSITGTDGLYFTDDDGLQLMLPCSPALNSGNNNFVATNATDLNGRPRVYSGKVDMGAYEAQASPGQALNTVYVNAQAKGVKDGSSWTNAFTSLQQALQYCADTIKVAAGTYYPSNGDTEVSFWLEKRMVILGGYPNAGNPSNTQRDPSKFVTRLSGALPQSNGARSLRIVFINRADSTTIIDGLVISDAGASLPFLSKSAVRITNGSSPRFRNCVFESNMGQMGGAVQIDLQSRPTFTNCKFVGNNADHGGAFAVTDGSVPSFFNCRFQQNVNREASDGIGLGGAGFIVGASANFDSCQFVNNFSNIAGGALYFKNKATAQFRASSFNGNGISTIYGIGGNDVYHDDAQTYFKKCVFADSAAGLYGGAIYNLNSAPRFEGCEFRNGNANRGGAVYNDASSPRFFSCVFYRNMAGEGGVLYNTNRSSVLLVNCIAAENGARSLGTVVFNENSSLEMINCTLVRNDNFPGRIVSPAVVSNRNGSNTVLKNSVLWANLLGMPENLGPDINNHPDADEASSTTLFNSATQKYGTHGANRNFVGVNPRLVNYLDADGPDDKFFTVDDGVRLSACSPLINAGANGYITGFASDVLEQPRIINGITDIGAYELQQANSRTNVYYVNLQAKGNNDGTSWANAYTSLHMALANVCADTIKVAAGTYFTATKSADSAFTVTTGAVILGGYPTEGNPTNSQRDPVKYPVVLSGNIGNTAINTDNANHVVSMVHTDGKAVLDGFVIEGGNAVPTSGDYPNNSGAGILVGGSDVAVRNCVIQNNSVKAGSGGGMHVHGGSRALLDKVVIRNNKGGRGGGLSIFGQASISNVVLEGNEAEAFGGGLYTEAKNVSIVNAVFYQNKAEFSGGGAYHVTPDDFTYTNSTFVKNSAFHNQGGGVFVEQANRIGVAKFYNSVFLANTFAGSDKYVGADVYYSYYSQAAEWLLMDLFTNCALQTVFNTIDQVHNNPAFADINNAVGNDSLWMTKDDGLQLTHCSALINKGTNDPMSGVSSDINAAVRIQDKIVDVGAYEYLQTIFGTALANAPADTLIADKEFTDSLGWTHYFNDCSYLLSIRKNGKNIGSVANKTLTIGVVTTARYGSGQGHNFAGTAFNDSAGGLYGFNKFWYAQSNFVIADSLQIRFPYAQTDFEDVKGSVVGLTQPGQLKFYTAIKSTNPFSNTLTKDSVIIYTNSTTSSTRSALLFKEGNINFSEFYIRQFGSGSATAAQTTPLPDLAITGIFFPAATKVGETSFAVSFQLRNLGLGAANGNNVAFYLSTDSLLSQQDILIGDHEVKQLLPAGGRTDTIRKQLPIPCGIRPDNYYLFATADSKNQIAEANEGNNTLRSAIQIVNSPGSISEVLIRSNRLRDTLCKPDSATLTASVQGCVGCTFMWNTGDTTAAIVVRQSGPYTVWVTHPCGQISATKSLVFSDTPAINPSVSVPSICMGSSFLLLDPIRFFADSVVWSGPGLSVTSKLPVAVTPTTVGSHIYTETAYTRTGCSTSKSVTVVVNTTQTPKVEISLNGCTNPAIFTIANTHNAGASPVYSWYKNDTLVRTGDSMLSFSHLTNGTKIYAVMHPDNVCAQVDSVRSNQIVYNCVPVDTTILPPPPDDQNIIVAPNPSDGHFVMLLKLQEPTKAAIRIFDSNGAEVYVMKEELWSGEVRKEIDIRPQSSGTYILKLQLGNQTHTIRLIVAR